MPVDLEPIAHATRLLFAVPLRPLQGARFQPTGFPNLGAATYQTPEGTSLLVESAQSMANRLEATCWAPATNDVIEELRGVSHVTVERKGSFLTDTTLESHRLNSVYVEKAEGGRFHEALATEIGVSDQRPVDRAKLIRTLFKYDIGSLVHGVFLESIDGRLRIARALSAFVEADGVQVVASGGVKIDRIQPGKEEGQGSSEGFGNVPFARDEYTAQSITLYVNLDLAQIRGYGLGGPAERLLVLLALYKLRRLLDGDLRLRTACDLVSVERGAIPAQAPEGFVLPAAAGLEHDLRTAIDACQDEMTHTTVTFDDALKKAKNARSADQAEDDQASEDQDDPESGAGD
ncbi:MAG: type I-U CRISPR-associated protein Cas7 [Planctomycetes bacterium]|nr:type I-U CRISPR-associated protein Cas7 [Planctomycetota bacterium]